MSDKCKNCVACYKATDIKFYEKCKDKECPLGLNASEHYNKGE